MFIWTIGGGVYGTSSEASVLPWEGHTEGRERFMVLLRRCTDVGQTKPWSRDWLFIVSILIYCLTRSVVGDISITIITQLLQQILNPAVRSFQLLQPDL